MIPIVELRYQTGEWRRGGTWLNPQCVQTARERGEDTELSMTSGRTVIVAQPLSEVLVALGAAPATTPGKKR